MIQRGMWTPQTAPLGRRAGVLLHVTSLPGPGGCGDLGPAAHHFVSQLAAAGQRAWQVLPIGPTGYGDSPYQTSSVLAGNPLLVSPAELVRDGLLHPDDLNELPAESARADFGAAIWHKGRLFARALARFVAQASPAQARAFQQFCDEEKDWLPDFALFMALKDEHAGAPWISWPDALRTRQPDALRAAQQRLSAQITLHSFLQWQFARQFAALRDAARAADVALIGDVPIFVAHDSVEVWMEPSQFLLHPDGRLKVQAGVPPDYFSKTGQLWGNPLYDYARMQADGFAFWRRRMARAAALFDIVRIDHFRGFAAHWEVPGDDQTAEHGRWVTAPGAALFSTLSQASETAHMRLIAEDLGVITPDVEALRTDFSIPGIRVLQFGFGPDAHFVGRPWGCGPDRVLYSSTHDNATLCGWYRGEPDGTRTPEQAAEERTRIHDYLGYIPAPADVNWALLRLAYATAASLVIAPIQDVLGLGNEARMNTPGQREGNWCFRLRTQQLQDPHLEALRKLTQIYGRDAG